MQHNNPERQTNQEEVNYPLIERLKGKPVLFLAEQSNIPFEQVEELRQRAGNQILYACDFYINGIEPYEQQGFFQQGRIINLDHHSEAKSVSRVISSTNMVLEYKKKHPDYAKQNFGVVTHHVDCDSVLSTLILRGVLAPEERFGIAAIAADHTGEANDIADLLQAIKRGPEGNENMATVEENKARFEYVVKNLHAFLNNQPIDESARIMLNHRLEQRAGLEDLKNKGEFGSAGKNQEVIFLPTEASGRLDPTLLIGVFPNAKVIFTYYQLPNGNYIYNCRLGKDAEIGTDLRQVMAKSGLQFGGRWSAGANKRQTSGAGTPIKPKDYADKIYSSNFAYLSHKIFSKNAKNT